MSDRSSFVLIIRPEPAERDHLGRDPMIRLRLFLKDCLRRYGWRCVSIQPAEGVQAEPEPDAIVACRPAVGAESVAGDLPQPDDGPADSLPAKRHSRCNCVLTTARIRAMNGAWTR